MSHLLETVRRLLEGNRGERIDVSRRLLVDVEAELAQGALFPMPPPRNGSASMMRLDHAESCEGREEGIARSYNASPPEWRAAAREAAITAALMHERFTTDAIWELGLAKPPNSATALGNVLRQLAREGVLVKTGRFVPTNQAASHKSPICEWRRAAQG